MKVQPAAESAWRASVGPSRRILNGRSPLAGEIVDEVHVPVVTRGTPAQRATGQRLVTVPIVGCAWPVVLCLGQRGLVQQAAALGDLLLAIAIGQEALEALIADAVEAGREHVDEPAPDELGRVQRHGLLVGRTAAVRVAEAHGAAIEAVQTLVADGDPVRVAACSGRGSRGPVRGRRRVASHRRPTWSRGPGGGARRSAMGR